MNTLPTAPADQGSMPHPASALAEHVGGLRTSIIHWSETHPGLARIACPVTAQILHLLQILLDLIADWAAGTLPPLPAAKAPRPRSARHQARARTPGAARRRAPAPSPCTARPTLPTPESPRAAAPRPRAIPSPGHAPPATRAGIRRPPASRCFVPCLPALPNCALFVPTTKQIRNSAAAQSPPRPPQTARCRSPAASR
jgi:hypothetical protein